MTFANELKEFTSGFATGWKLATPTAAEVADRKAREEKEGLAAAGDKAESEMGGRGPGYTYPEAGSAAAKPATAGGKLPSFVEGTLLQKAADAVSGKESGGNYRAVGPTHSKYGRALGKYQVMETNVPSWTKEALGKSLTPDEFLADDKAQDAVFQHRFGGYLSRTGSIADAASMWHSGVPVAQAGNRKDSLGTKTTDYARGVAATVNGKRAALELPEEYQPVQMAAEGGLVLSREEALREARAAAMDAEEAPTVGAPTSWREPETTGAIPIARGIPAEEGAVIPAGGAVQATAPSMPAPPRRPGVLAVTRPSNTAIEGAPMPPRRPEDAQLNDSGAALPGEGMTAESDEPYDPRRVAHTAGIADAIDTGMKAIGRAFGFSEDTAALPTARTDRQAKLVAFSRNEGAATETEIRQIDKTIDPNNKLSEDARAVARLYGGYKYFLSKGEPDKAANYAKSIMLYTRLHMQTSGALAEDRIKSGDVAGGAKIIQEAHNQIPDGSSLYVDKVDPATGKVDYRMVDEDGDLTERGQATTNQLLQLATGMRNGSEWLSQMEGAKKGSLTAAQKLREKNRQADVENLDKFQSGDTDNDFLNSLAPERREAFQKLSPRVQRQVTQDWRRQQDQKRAQDTQEERYRQNDERTLRQDKRQEEREKKADESRTKAEKDNKDQQEFSFHRDAIRDAADDIADQMAQDPDDTAKLKPLQDKLKAAQAAASDWTKADGGRVKYTRDLDRVLKPQRGTGGAGASTGKAGGGTESERKVSALEDQFVREQRRVVREGNKPEDLSKLSAMRADIEFKKRDTGFDEDAVTKLDMVLPKALGKKDMDGVDPADRTDYRDAVGGILRGDNGIAAEDAVDIAKLAVKTGKIKRLDDGRYEVNGARPVYMSPESLQAIARIRQRTNPKPKTEEVKNPFSTRQQRGSSPGEMGDASVRAEEVQERRGGPGNRRGNIRNAAEFERLKNSLGESYKDGMSLAQMRKSLRDRERADEFRGRSLPPLT